MSILDFAIDHVRHNRPVFPGIPGGKIPAIKNPYESATLDEKQIIRWWKENPQYNICLPAGIEVEPGLFLVVIDFDRKGSNGFLTKDFMAEMGKNFPDTLTQITAGNGEHMLYTVTFLPGNGVGLIGPGIDHRGFRGYYMGAGSWCNGKEYVYKNNLLVEKAPGWLEENIKHRPKKTEPLQVVGVVNQNIAVRKGLEFIEALPAATEGERNDKAYRAACQLKNIGLDRDAAVSMLATSWKSEPALEPPEIEHAVNSAYKYSRGALGEKAPEAFFDVIPPEKEPPKGPLDLMIEKYALCRMGGTSVVLDNTTDEEGRAKVDFLKLDCFHTEQAGNTVDIGDRPVQVSKLWVKSKSRRTYRGVVFNPGYTGKEFFNFWQGFAVEPLESEPTAKAKKALENFKSHIIRNVAQDNIEHANWVFTWLAHIFQRPGEKPRTGVVLRGKKGVGKSAIFECVSKLLGSHYLSVSGRRYITGNFNAHLEGKLLYILEEAFWAKDKNADSILKDLVTNNHVQIERKGKESYSTKNLCRVVVVGNAPWLVDASAEERRYAVFEVTPGNRGDEEFFGSMVEDMDPRLLLKFFMEWDLTKANINRIPKTQELLSQKEYSGDALSSWWAECIKTGAIGDKWPEHMAKDTLRQVFREEMRARNYRGDLPSNTYIGRFLKHACPSSGHKQTRDGEQRLWAYTLPSLEVARQEWDQYIGQEGDYDTE